MLRPVFAETALMHVPWPLSASVHRFLAPRGIHLLWFVSGPSQEVQFGVDRSVARSGA